METTLSELKKELAKNKARGQKIQTEMDELAIELEVLDGVIEETERAIFEIERQQREEII